MKKHTVQYDGKKILIEIDVSDLDQTQKYYLESEIRYNIAVVCGTQMKTVFNMSLNEEDTKSNEERLAELNKNIVWKRPKRYRCI
jgi:hypothetical protein